MKLSFQGKYIHYTVQGQGTALVLLHGFLESSEIWNDLVSRLSPNRKIICIDLPGHGLTDCFSVSHSMEFMAACVHAVLEDLSIERTELLGHSMGGYVALAFLELYPSQVSSVFLLNSTPEADSPERKEIRERSILLVQKNKKAFISMAIGNLLSQENKKRYAAATENLKLIAMKTPMEGIIAALSGMKIRPDRTALLRSFPGQKIIATGENDPLIPKDRINSLSAQCECSFHVFKGGHLSYIESPKELLELCISTNK